MQLADSMNNPLLALPLGSATWCYFLTRRFVDLRRAVSCADIRALLYLPSVLNVALSCLGVIVRQDDQSEKEPRAFYQVSLASIGPWAHPQLIRSRPPPSYACPPS